MKGHNKIRAWLALIAGGVVGWLMVHLLVVNWEKIKTFLAG
jgi:hypothetical protein